MASHSCPAAAAMWLPEYRLVGALLLAYCLVAAGALMQESWYVVRTGISYGMYIYAFPVQQLLVIGGVLQYGLAVLSAAALLPTCLLAYVSRHLLEKPALAHKAR